MQETQEETPDRSRIKRNWPLFITLVLILGALATLLYLQGSWNTSKKTPVYIAVVIPGAENNAKVSIDIERGAKLCLAEQNQLSDQYDFRLTVIDEQNPDLMEMYGDDTDGRVREVATRIVSSDYSNYYNAPHPIAVLGHWTSGRSTTAGEIYKGNIVALTGTALADGITADNPWYFRTVFNNTTQAEFLAEFIYKTLGHQRVYVIGQQPDKYSEELTGKFVDMFTRLGGEIAGIPYMLDMNTGEEMYKTAIDYFATQELEEAEIPLVLLLQVTEAREIASRLKLESSKYPTLRKYIFVGGDSVSSVDFANYKAAEFGARIPNYAEGTISVSPILYDVAGFDAQRFLRDIKTYAGDSNYDPSWRAVTFYEAACAVTEAVKDARISGDPSKITTDRKLIQETLTGYNSPQTAIPGIIGPIYFDANRNITHPVMLGTYRNGELISYHYQYSKAEHHQASKLQVGGIPLQQVSVSYAGIELIEISNLDLNEATFSADFYIWFLHSDPDIDNSNVEFVNAENEIALGEPLEEVQVGDLYYHLYRVKGPFRGQFDFRQYPFDKQSIEIKFRNAKKSYDELIYVVDVVGVDAENLATKLRASTALSHIHGWKLDDVTFFQEVVSNKSALGNPAKIGQNADKEFSVINYRIDFKRDTLNFTIKNMLPVLLAVVVTYVSFFLSLQQINTTRTVVTGSLLTVALMHSGLARNLPPVDYITMLDILFYIVYFVIFAEVGITVLAQRAYEDEDHVKAQRLVGFGRAFFPVTILVGSVVLSFII